jgi:transcriptional/translational regulatory protein YebC/TACO1
MPRKLKLSQGACEELAEWFKNYQRIGTFAEKAKEVGVSEQTLRNAIDRGLGRDDGNLRQKLSNADIRTFADLLLIRST